MTKWDEKTTRPALIGGERRRDRRYALELDVKWKLIRRRRVLDAGRAVTIDLSSGGVLIEADGPLPSGLQVELAITWPVKLHNTAPMQLVITGKIVRVNGRRVAVRSLQHEFRTIGTPGEHPDSLRSSALNPMALLRGTPWTEGLGNRNS